MSTALACSYSEIHNSSASLRTIRSYFTMHSSNSLIHKDLKALLEQNKTFSSQKLNFARCWGHLIKHRVTSNSTDLVRLLQNQIHIFLHSHYLLMYISRYAPHICICCLYIHIYTHDIIYETSVFHALLMTLCCFERPQTKLVKEQQVWSITHRIPLTWW